MLSLVSTPIGNLTDISFRSLEILKESDYILCEDTRHSLKLFTHYAIQKPLFSLHSHNESKKIETILADLRSGKKIALVCDAGTPGICDPSALLVRRCRQENLKVVAAAGPSSVTSALSLFGLIHPFFQFLGFIPKETKDATLFLDRALNFDGLSIFFDTPHQIEKTLKIAQTKAPEKKFYIAKELTKIHESIEGHLPFEWLEKFNIEPIKGELVCLIEGEKKEAELLQEEHIMQVLSQEASLSYNDKIRLASKILNKPKNALYKKWL